MKRNRINNYPVIFGALIFIALCMPSCNKKNDNLSPNVLFIFVDDLNDWALENCVPLPGHYRNNGYLVYGAGKLLHEGAGGDFYTEYGPDVDYGPHP